MVGKKEVKSYKYQKAHLHSIRDLCVEYQRNPPVGFEICSGNKNAERQTDAHPGWGIKTAKVGISS